MQTEIGQMNIGLIFFNEGAYGGAEKRVVRIANWLAENSSHKFFLFLSNRMLKWIRSQGITINRELDISLYDDMRNYHKSNYKSSDEIITDVRANSSNSLKMGFVRKSKYLKGVYNRYRLLSPWIKKNQIKIVHGWHTASDALLLLKLLKRKKTIISIVDANATIGTPAMWIGNFSYKSVFRFIDKIEFLSEDIYKQYMNKGLKLNANKVISAPCSFIDYTKTFINKKENLIAFSANRFEKKKNSPLVVEAANIFINHYNSNARFILMGGRIEEGIVRKKIKDYDIGRFVTVKYEKNVENTLSRALVFLSLQEINNYPSQALLEAMACGCAIIATDVGETKKLVDEKVGFLVSKSPEEIANKIKFLLENPEIAEQMGRKARERVVRNHTIQRYGEYITKIYDSLIYD